MTLDPDSTIREIHGSQKQGAAYGYTKHLGYHPLTATSADTGLILDILQRKGPAASSRGARRFIGELAAVGAVSPTAPHYLCPGSAAYGKDVAYW